MQNSFDKYMQYTATDFALDDDFINWALLSGKENDTFWNEYIFNNPEQKKNIEVAKNIILSFDTSEEKIPDEIKNRIWQSIISQSTGGRVIKMKFREYLHYFSKRKTRGFGKVVGIESLYALYDSHFSFE